MSNSTLREALKFAAERLDVYGHVVEAVEVRKALDADDAARETMPCGHPPSLLLHSAETGEPLYCELCDDKSGRADAERRESELAEANAALRQELAALKASRAAAPKGEIVVTKNEAGDIVLVSRQDEAGHILSIVAEGAAAPSRDAYEGCREDLLDWKRRALEAEETCRQLNRALAEEVNGPTFMGEPLLAAAPQSAEPVARLVQIGDTTTPANRLATLLAEALGPSHPAMDDLAALLLAPPTDAEWQEEAMRLVEDYAATLHFSTRETLRAHIATRPLPAPPIKKEQL